MQKLLGQGPRHLQPGGPDGPLQRPSRGAHVQHGHQRGEGLRNQRGATRHTDTASYSSTSPTRASSASLGCAADDGYVPNAHYLVYHGHDERYKGHQICCGYNEDTLTIYDVEGEQRYPRHLAHLVRGRQLHPPGPGPQPEQG